MRKAIAMLILFCLVSGCFGKGVGKLPRIEGKKILMIIASSKYRDEELEKPYRIFKQQGAKVLIASTTLKKVRGMLGGVAKPDILIDKVKVKDYDAIIFVGGVGAVEYWNNPIAHKIAKEAVKEKKLLAAICIAPVTLANAGVLKGKRATVWISERQKIQQKGAIYTGANVERDGNIITANGPQSAELFADSIVVALAEKSRNKNKE